MSGEMPTPTPAGGQKVILYLLTVLVVIFSLPTSASAASVELNCTTLPVVNELYRVDDIVSNSSSIDYSIDNLVLSNSPTSDAVCTLVRVVESSALDGKPLYQPVGLSYAGRDWERVAGLDAAVVSYNCTATPGQCTVDDLPPPEAGTSYQIARYELSYSTANLASRFLSTVTVGPRIDEIFDLAADLEVTDGSDVGAYLQVLAAYIADQMDEDKTPPTLHRVYWRVRLASRQYQMTKAALIGPDACSAGSHWRKFAFTQQDLYLSKVQSKTETLNYATPGHRITIEELAALDGSNSTKYGISYGGQLRTILDDPWRTVDGDILALGEEYMYQLCRVDEIQGKLRRLHVF